MIWCAALLWLLLPTRAGLIHAIEALKQVGEMFLGNAGAIILHTHNTPAFLFTAQFHVHAFSAAAGILDPILNEIGQHLSQILWIAANQHFRQISSRQSHLTPAC